MAKFLIVIILVSIEITIILIIDFGNFLKKTVFLTVDFPVF